VPAFSGAPLAADRPDEIAMQKNKLPFTRHPSSTSPQNCVDIHAAKN
jgi:hypothetical protein